LTSYGAGDFADLLSGLKHGDSDSISVRRPEIDGHPECSGAQRAVCRRRHIRFNLKTVVERFSFLAVFIIAGLNSLAGESASEKGMMTNLDLGVISAPPESDAEIPRLMTIDAGTSLDIEAASLLPAPRPTRLIHGVVTVSGIADLQSSLEDDAGHARATRESMLAGLNAPLSEKTSLSASFEREWSQYAFDLNPPDIADIGFMHLSITRFGMIGRHKISDDWLFLAVADLTFSVEDRASWSDGLTYGGIAAVRQQVNKSFAWQVGLIAHTRLEDSAIVLPIPGIDWKINDMFSLQTAQGVTLSCKPSKSSRWIFDTGAGFENRVYRMDDRSSLPDGILIDRRIPLICAATFKPYPFLFAKFSASVPVYRAYKFCASDGTTVESYGSDLAPSFNVSISAMF